MASESKIQKLTVADKMPAAPDDTIPVTRMPLALRAFFDDALFNRVRQIAQYLARARGITPPHLLGNEEACFSVCIDSINWRLSPYMVARATYQTPEGKIGYEGKLVSAILQQSGALDGGIEYEMIGNWEKVTNKFKMEKSEKGKWYPVKTYTAEDEQGLGVTVSAQLHGESKPRALTFMLTQAYPRFSTLWATDPVTQIKYAAVRRFASVAMPQLIFGVPFDRDTQLEDITPAGILDLPTDATRARTARAALDAFASSAPAYDSETGEVTDAGPDPKGQPPNPAPDPALAPDPAGKPPDPDPATVPAPKQQPPEIPDTQQPPTGPQQPFHESPKVTPPQPPATPPEQVIPEMPTAYLEDWEERGEWMPAWRWLQARIVEQVPEVAQALAERHIHLLKRVAKHNRSYKTSVISALQRAQVDVNIE